MKEKNPAIPWGVLMEHMRKQVTKFRASASYHKYVTVKS